MSELMEERVVAGEGRGELGATPSQSVEIHSNYCYPSDLCNCSCCFVLRPHSLLHVFIFSLDLLLYLHGETVVGIWLYNISDKNR